MRRLQNSLSFPRVLWVALCCFVVGSRIACAAGGLRAEVVPLFGASELKLDALTLTNLTGQRLSVTRMDLLLSDVALRRSDGAWIERTNWQAYISIGEKRADATVPEIPAGNYDRIRFHIGLRPELNHGNPAQYAPDHPLNPNWNGLHWNWANGYVFFAIEGHWLDAKAENSGYSFHLGNDPMLMTVELPLQQPIGNGSSVRLLFHLEKIFDFEFSNATSSTHSRDKDDLAVRLRDSVIRCVGVEQFTDVASGAGPAAKPTPQPHSAEKLNPYRFTFSSQFPIPELPRDNPLSEEGVELGHQLFFEKSLSINGQQSCASCHQVENAFVDAGVKFSIGAEGRSGTRNTMPIFNLAWKKSFFWDGRALTIRDQVVQPIQNPIEMHETLTNVVVKLKDTGGTKGEGKLRLSQTNGKDPIPDYPQLFARVFGTPEITPERIAKALEQFVLVQLSFNSKFDRAMEGKAELTEEEKRGFQLFLTEYDPRREQFGADCFHCHGAPFFSTHGFANNGLDAEFPDLGRYDVTKNEGDKGKFSVPSLRNIELTGPYMHDGRFKTLEQVIEHYATGVKRSATLDPNIAKHPDGGVPLSDADKKALVAFLKTLTDEKYRVQPR